MFKTNKQALTSLVKIFTFRTLRPLEACMWNLMWHCQQGEEPETSWPVSVENVSAALINLSEFTLKIIFAECVLDNNVSHLTWI